MCYNNFWTLPVFDVLFFMCKQELFFSFCVCFTTSLFLFAWSLFVFTSSFYRLSRSFFVYFVFDEFFFLILPSFSSLLMSCFGNIHVFGYYWKLMSFLYCYFYFNRRAMITLPLQQNCGSWNYFNNALLPVKGNCVACCGFEFPNYSVSMVLFTGNELAKQS